MFLWLTWLALDPNFPSKKGSYHAYGSGKGALLLLLVTILPVWARVPLLFGFVGYFIRLGFHRIRHAFDNVPDLAIGPEGISGLDELGYCSMPWSDLFCIDVSRVAIRIYEQQREAHWLIRWIAGERVMFLYTRAFFKAPHSEILSAIRYYRPDLWIGVSQASSIQVDQTPPA
ncbi:hypothetical protein MAE02_42430 [Microvirga aerophila]|uniref:Uncharacterized protein n=2 Tax=Microvirga aerophila TaxID=670291 RepID=A0A512BXG6_9HYPH|nr:hypothetical protein MAE02_42430 [Microvirga aerophila]